MSNLLVIQEKTGRVIYLSNERWDHIQKHRKISGNTEKIIETLKYPSIIIKDEPSEDKYIYYRYYKEDKEYLTVLVKYLNGDGFIITSFFTDRIK